MKLKIFSFLACLAAIVCISSCIGTDGPIYSGSEMCTVVSGTLLVTDGGVAFNIIESYAGAIPDTLKRVVAQCEVLKQTDDKGTQYDIRLVSYEPVITKDPVKKSTADEEALGSDGINVYNCWVENGYINTYLNITELVLSKNKHAINLEWDDLKSCSDTVYVKLRHNGFGESYDNEALDSDNVGITGYYASFPLSGIIAGAGQEFVLHIDWEWFKVEASQYSHEKETLSADITLSK